MTPVEKVLATARAEIGYLEKASNAQLDSKTANAGDKNWTKYARDLDAMGVYDGKKNGYPWCDVFVDWCLIRTFGLELALKMTGQKLGCYGAGCTASANYYRAMGRFFKSAPRPGDQIFFSQDGGKTSYHTGLVEKVQGGRVYTIEGNTSSAAGVVENGGAVQDKSYSLSYNKIGGYGRPDYSLIQEDDEDMNQETFKKMWLEMRRDLQDNDSGSYSKEAREWAVKTGLVKGGGKLPDGSDNYMWEDLLTREQMATLLYRFAQMAGLL